ncbi:DUF1798 family protein [Ornithinibacillus halophilus]|uniref:DUF1798 family protein n=1 Tax=Ornithinibacillus halophilus TaxID=930117 RepID=A0A1M5CN05_9BACI|nr:DUF1798 family protein [Ornithinibacillus halophilus]SHF55792.1 protein of unknown function [Ornithinibacillus halophilus]
MDLLEQTKQLSEHLEMLKQTFEKNQPPEDRKDKAFFLMVKEKTNPIYEQLAVWEEVALAYVKDRKINVHPHQVSSTRENMELVMMHSFYVDVRRKRFMELHNSIQYIFDQIIRELSLNK